MLPTDHVPSPEDLGLLNEILRRIARTRLSPSDAEDFVQSAQVKLLERHYDVFTRFAGRSSLRTYLTVVVTRLLLDWRNSTRGKWRPSAAASHMGDHHAILFDRLINRDGLSADEAIEVVRRGHGAPDVARLRSLVDRLPRRIVKRQVPEDVLEEHGQRAADPIEEDEQRQDHRRAWRALATALRQLPHEDRWLVRQRYFRRHTVREIADAICTDERKLYQRYDRLLRSLRFAIERSGVTASAVKTA